MSFRQYQAQPVTQVDADGNPTGTSERPQVVTGEFTLSGSNLRHAEAVTPDDDNDLTGVATYPEGACAVYVGGSGDVVVTVGATDITFTALAAGLWHPMPPYTRVKEASTATGIVAGY